MSDSPMWPREWGRRCFRTRSPLGLRSRIPPPHQPHSPGLESGLQPAPLAVKGPHPLQIIGMRVLQPFITVPVGVPRLIAQVHLRLPGPGPEQQQ